MLAVLHTSGGVNEQREDVCAQVCVCERERDESNKYEKKKKIILKSQVAEREQKETKVGSGRRTKGRGPFMLLPGQVIKAWLAGDIGTS